MATTFTRAAWAVAAWLFLADAALAQGANRDAAAVRKARRHAHFARLRDEAAGEPIARGKPATATARVGLAAHSATSARIYGPAPVAGDAEVTLYRNVGGMGSSLGYGSFAGDWGGNDWAMDLYSAGWNSAWPYYRRPWGGFMSPYVGLRPVISTGYYGYYPGAFGWGGWGLYGGRTGWNWHGGWNRWCW